MRIRSYFQYIVKRKNAHGIHSPFVFEFYNEILKKAKFIKAHKAEDYLKKLRLDSSVIQRNDLGAGSSKLSNEVSIKSIAKVAGTPVKYGRLLYRITDYYGFKNVLELGTSVGAGTSFLLESDHVQTLSTIEGCEETSTYVRTKLNEFYPNKKLNIIQGEFNEALKNLTEGYDLIFIDGNHTYDGTLSNYNSTKKKLRKGGLIIFDDIHWSEEMFRAWSEIIQYPEVTVSMDLFKFGIIAMKEGQAKEHFILKY